MSLPAGLSSLGGGKDDHHTSASARRERDKDTEPPDTSAGLVQRCVIIQRDEKGYGFTVTGDNPVFVASVKPDGAASRAGVQNNDRIVKVNGTLVTSRNHLDVVKLIKSGSYVALTLLGKPQPTNTTPATPPIANPSMVNRDSMFAPGLVTAPQPVNADKDRELAQHKILMTRAMYETACDEYTKLEKQFLIKPSEKLQNQMQEKKRTVDALGNQLEHLNADGHSAQSHRRTPSNPFTTSSSSPSNTQHQQQSQSIKHVKQKSVPALVGRCQSGDHFNPEMRGAAGSAAVARSKSDAAARKNKAASIFYVANQAPAADMSEASSLPSATSDPSMSDSPHTSPSISPTPIDAMLLLAAHRHNGQDTDDSMMRQEIIHDEDEDMGDDVQINDPGPFVDIKSLESKPAHMAVLLKYLIDNMDPSPVLFYIISSAYSRCSANVKELRKWAYEIYSVFIAQGCPLNIGLDDKENIINQMDNILTTAASRTDNESTLRSMFEPAQACIQSIITDFLVDFRNKKDLGMANFYGFDKLHDNMDKTTAGKVAEEILCTFLENVAVSSDEYNSSVNDREMATGWAVATFLRLNGVGISSKTSHSPVWDRISSFMMKDKKFKLPVSRSSKAKSVKGHQFTNQHFYVTTICNRCGHLIWGVGYQGFQCQSCEMTVHKQCVDDVTEMCGGKKKRIPRLAPRKPSTISQTSVISNQSQGSNTTDTSSVGSFQDHPASGGPSIQPIPRDEDDLAGIPTGHSVKSIAKRYEENSPLDPTSSSPMTTSTTSSGGFEGLDIPSGTSGSLGNGVSRGSTDLNRSGSLNNKGEKGGDRQRARRAKSDVEMDTETFKAINQSGSSSTSSMSNRSGESPSTSTDNMHEQEELDRDVEPELPPLKQVLGDDVLRKLKPKEKKRQEVINELMYTERAHLRNLRVLDKVFNQPMRNDIEFMSELAKALFPNLDEMIKLHESITKDFKDRREDNPVISNVGDILLKRFDGENGGVFRKGCAEYCRNQAHTLEALKRQTRKEAKLAQFLSDAESKPVCRRLHLRDLVPCQMQRLTKYPLLIENLMKYTPTSSEEYKHLQRASERCKHILSYVNHAVKECENYHKLKEIQKKLDKKSLEASTDAAVQDIKNLKLVDKKLIFDGPLEWKLKQNRTIDLHVLLLEDMLVLLQKQDDKYVLKYQNSNAGASRDSQREESKYTHSPVLKLRNLLARDVATDEKSFFVVNISEVRAQMYQLIASTKELREKWGKLINERAQELKSSDAEKTPGNRPLSALPSRQMDKIEVETAKIARHTLHSHPGHSDKEDMDSLDGLSRLAADEDEEEEEEEGLVQPNEVCVSNVVTAEATPMRTPLEMLRHNTDIIATALEERHRLLAQLMELHPPLSSLSTLSTTTSAAATSSSSPLPSSTTTISSSSSSLHPTTSSNQTPVIQMGPLETTATDKKPTTIDEGQEEEEEQQEEQDKQQEVSTHKDGRGDGADPGGTMTTNVPSGGDGDHDDNNNLEGTLLLRAVTKVNEFTMLVMHAQNESVSVMAQQHQEIQQHQQQLQQQQQQQRPRRASADSGNNNPLLSPTRRITCGIALEMSSDTHSGQMGHSSTPSSRPSSSPSQSSSAAALSSKPPLPPLSPLSSSLSSPPAAGGGNKSKVAMPLDQLKEMMAEMNAIMAKLMSTVNNGREEKRRLNQELKEARAKMDALKERQKQMIISGAVPPDRFTDDDQDYIQQQQQGPSSYLSSPAGIATTVQQAPLSPSSLSSPPTSPLSQSSLSSSYQQQQPQTHLSLQTSILEEESSSDLPLSAATGESESLSSTQQEVHHGIQEAVEMAESVETLDSAPFTQTATVVGDKRVNDNNNDNVNKGDDVNPGDVGDKVIEVAMEDDDDDDIVDTNVSMADLPLPDMASVPPLSSSEGGVNVMVDSSGSMEVGGRGLLDNVELEEMSDEDDSETIVGKGERSLNTSHDSVQALGGGDGIDRKIKVKGGDNDEEGEEEYADAIEI